MINSNDYVTDSEDTRVFETNVKISSFETKISGIHGRPTCDGNFESPMHQLRVGINRF